MGPLITVLSFRGGGGDVGGMLSGYWKDQWKYTVTEWIIDQTLLSDEAA